MKSSKILKFYVMALWLFANDSAMALSLRGLSAKPKLPTMFIHTNAGITTYKSKMLQSTNTGSDVGYGFGLYAGRSKAIGMIILQDSSNMSFEHADESTNSTIALTTRSTIIPIQFWRLSFGPIVNQTQLTVSKKGAKYLDSMTSGLGGFGGTFFPFRKGTVLYVNAKYILTNILKDSIQESTTVVSMGPRMDLSVYLDMNVTESLIKLQIGYRQRTFSVKVGSESFTETMLTNWAALALNINF